MTYFVHYQYQIKLAKIVQLISTRNPAHTSIMCIAGLLLTMTNVCEFLRKSLVTLACTAMCSVRYREIFA